MKHDRFVICADSHGDMVDPVASKALFAHIADWKPQIRIHLGDAFDFRNLRRGASDEEKAHSLQDDWDAGSDFLRKFFDGGKQNHFLRGNHDERLYDLCGSATGIIRVILEHDAIQREMAFQARTDSLTGLLNRRAFLDEVSRRADRLEREDLPATMMFIDLDHFKALRL